MANRAVARDAVFALRREIARIEGTLPQRLETPAEAGDAARLGIGVAGFDKLLGGGLAMAALTEIHGHETRDSGAVSGFALALAGLLLSQAKEPGPVLWVGMSEVFREAGFPHAAGAQVLSGLSPERLLFAEAPKLADALWVAEEAIPLQRLAAVVVEVRGNPEKLDLTATRRLHRRAQAAGRPVLLLRQAAQAETTAAPVRLVVSPAPSGSRRTLAGPLEDSIGRPAFTVSVDKCPAALPGLFTLEWNCDERLFTERANPQIGAANPVAVVSLSGCGKGSAPAAGQVVAFRKKDASAAGAQPAPEQRDADRGPRRTG
ncbi:ImuA family protein [Aquamicrobium ahrensii]|uniref:Protein ImuA n=1 Tax=Aquamicrobium ahrensii TaxID=469551 RepID=A0ABV2KLV2_9HYPH